MVTAAHLIASADEIDNRLGPIPGRSSDRIAVELRAAAKIAECVPAMLAALRRIASAVEITAADMDVVLAAISKADAA